MKRNNLSKHLKVCVWKTQVEMKREDFLSMKRSGKVVDEAEYESRDVAYGELSKYLTDIYNHSIYLYRKLIQNKPRAPADRLWEMQVSEVTKKCYLREWKHYEKWLKKNGLYVGKDSANTYLASLTKVKESTLRTKHSLLENILKFLIDPTITLNPFNKRITFTPKYVMKDEEIGPYLEEQKEVNTEYYLIQKLMISYGLRVNSIASLRIKHLEFLEDGNAIHFPDSKVKKERTETVPDDFQEEILDFLPSRYDENDFVFYRDGKELSERQRAHDISVAVNRKIRKSKVIKKTANYKYSSHMFRKTRVYNDYEKGVENLKEAMRRRIGQSKGSSAINSYINTNI